MVQRKGKQGGGGLVQGGQPLEEARVVLQAVVLADSFAEAFRPITLDRPKVLLPLAGIPMIDYTLEWLAAEGVEECFVLCCSHAQQVFAHLSAAGWLGQSAFKVSTVVARDCISTGDALRHIDQKGFIQGDFVLVSGDVVANVPLAAALHEHRERRKKDKQAVQTLLMRRSSVNPLTWMTPQGAGQQLLGLDPSSKQLLLYEPPSPWGPLGPSRKSITVDESQLEEHPSLEVHGDWEDCHVDICGLEVLHLYTDNFDYQHPRRDFVKGVLSDDIMGNKIFVHEVPGAAYAAKVETLRSYVRVTSDVLSRWTFPFTPDAAAACSPKAEQYSLDSGNAYMGPGVSIARTCHVGASCLIGRGTALGESARVLRSVVGRNCSIGRGAVLESCVVWDDVRVGDGARLSHCVVCDGAQVGERAVVDAGAVVSFNVVVLPGSHVVPLSRLSLHPQPEDEGSDDEHLEYSEASAADDSDDDVPEEDGEERAPGAQRVHRWKDAHGPLVSWRGSCAPLTDAVRQQLQEALERAERGTAVGGSVGAVEGQEGQGEAEAAKATKEADDDQTEEDEEEEEEDEDEFSTEVAAYFKRAVDGVSQDNVVLEVNTLKFAFNKTFADCASAMFKAILSHSVGSSKTSGSAGTSGKQVVAAVKAGVTKWGPLLRRFLKSTDDEVEVLLTLEEECLESHRSLAPCFQHVLQHMYDADCITEDAIMAWAEEKKDASAEDKKFLKQCEQFIKWLQEAEEEDEEEGDDGDDE